MDTPRRGIGLTLCIVYILFWQGRNVAADDPGAAPPPPQISYRLKATPHARLLYPSVKWDDEPPVDDHESVIWDVRLGENASWDYQSWDVTVEDLVPCKCNCKLTYQNALPGWNVPSDYYVSCTCHDSPCLAALAARQELGALTRAVTDAKAQLRAARRRRRELKAHADP